MRRAEGVVFAFGALREARKPAPLPERADTVAAAGQDLVRIGLMADIPDDPVFRRIENVVEHHGEFDHAEPGTEVAARLGDGVDHLRTQLVGKLAQIALTHRAEIRRRVYPVKQGGNGTGQYSPRPRGPDSAKAGPEWRAGKSRAIPTLSVAARYNEMSRLTQKIGSFIKQIKMLDSLVGQHPGLGAGPFKVEMGYHLVTSTTNIIQGL